MKIQRTGGFKRDVKLMKKRNKDMSKLVCVITRLYNQEQLPVQYRDHALSGQYTGTRECHIEPDWLLIYTLSKVWLRLERTGTHSDLFK